MSRRLPERDGRLAAAAAAAAAEEKDGPADVIVVPAAALSALRRAAAAAEAGVVGGRPNLPPPPPPLSAELSSSIRVASWPRRAAILRFFGVGRGEFSEREGGGRLAFVVVFREKGGKYPVQLASNQEGAELLLEAQRVIFSFSAPPPCVS